MSRQIGCRIAFALRRFIFIQFSSVMFLSIIIVSQTFIIHHELFAFTARFHNLRIAIFRDFIVDVVILVIFFQIIQSRSTFATVVLVTRQGDLALLTFAAHGRFLLQLVVLFVS